MALFGHVGGFFAFAAFILLLLVSLSVPIIHSIDFLYVNEGTSRYTFGNWGYCAYENGARSCSSSHLGYSVGTLANQLSNSSSSDSVRNALEHGLTFALVLHPIAAGFAFLAFLLAVCAHIVTHILGSIIAFFAFLITVVALGIDLGLFLAARHRFNENLSGSPAHLGNAMWMVVAATVALLVSALTICFGSVHDRRNRRTSMNATPVAAAPVYTSEKPGRFGFLGRRRADVVQDQAAY